MSAAWSCEPAIKQEEEWPLMFNTRGLMEMKAAVIEWSRVSIAGVNSETPRLIMSYDASSISKEPQSWFALLDKKKGGAILVLWHRRPELTRLPAGLIKSGGCLLSKCGVGQQEVHACPPSWVPRTPSEPPKGNLANAECTHLR
jgi:hypothetical protein